MSFKGNKKLPLEEGKEQAGRKGSSVIFLNHRITPLFILSIDNGDLTVSFQYIKGAYKKD